MILTVTLNPSVDISYQLPCFQLNTSNRSFITNKTAGGKGLNVTRVLKCLNVPVKATGFLGGTNGLFIQKELDGLDIQHYFVPITSNTRNCIAILHDSNQTEILEEGPVLSQSEYELFLRKMEKLLPEVGMVVASGSIPKGLDPSFYQDLIKIANRYQKPFLLDTSGEPLKLAMEAKPTFIKPNRSEFEVLIGHKLETDEDVRNALIKAPFQVPYILVSLGEKGALIKHNEKIYMVTIPKVNALNPVGSGDATVAGFASGLFRGYETRKLFSYSVVMGLLNAIEIKTGYVNPTLISNYMRNIQIKQFG
jgi:tagatose 6-phosphate kinase